MCAAAAPRRFRGDSRGKFIDPAFLAILGIFIEGTIVVPTGLGGPARLSTDHWQGPHSISLRHSKIISSSHDRYIAPAFKGRLRPHLARTVAPMPATSSSHLPLNVALGNLRLFRCASNVTAESFVLG